MQDNFLNALEHVLAHEGGWADHPRDPGGATMKGVTLAVYQRYFGADKDKAALRAISDAELQHVYRTGYWEKCRCDELPNGVDYAVFDAAVNSGPGRSIRWLQAAVGTIQDGSIGARTLMCLDDCEPLQVIEEMCDHRLAFLHGLSTWDVFGKGWARRVEGVRSTALVMASGGELVAQTPSVDYKIIQRGSRGEWVKRLQRALAIQVDGKFGPATEAAVKAWQAENGLEVDGIAGRNTYRSLGLLA